MICEICQIECDYNEEGVCPECAEELFGFHREDDEQQG